MNFLKDQSDQARQAFLAMPMASRLIAGLLVVAIAVAMGFLVRGDANSDGEFLFEGRLFTESEFNAAQLAFGQADLTDWTAEGRRIKVPRKERADYLKALSESKALPGSLHTAVQEAIDDTTVFDSSEFSLRRVMHAKERDLSTSLTQMKMIRRATVTYDRGSRRGFAAELPQSASVMVVPEDSRPLSRGEIDMVKEYVRASFAGMSVDDVVVTDINAPSAGYGDDDDPVLRKQSRTEEHYEKKIRSLLSDLPAKVVVTATIDPTMDLERTASRIDAEPTTLFNKTRKLETSNNRRPIEGVPGTDPNAISNRPKSIEDSIESSTVKDDTRETQAIAGQQWEQSREAPLPVKRISVSISLPQSYYEELYAKDNPAAEGRAPEAEIEKIRSKITKDIRALVTPMLMPVAAGEDSYPLVEVIDMPDAAVELVAQPSASAESLVWLGKHWQPIALIGLAALALLVARSAVRAGGDSTPPEFVEGFGLDLPAPPVSEDAESEEADGMTITGTTLQGELMHVVEQNPEVAANVIRTWIGEAA